MYPDQHRHTHVLSYSLAHVCLELQIYVHIGVDLQMPTCSDPQFHTYPGAQPHKDAHAACLECTTALACAQSCTCMCRPTVARSHTHLSRHAHSSCILRVTVHARSIGALAYFRHDALVCSGLSMYTHVRAIEAYTYTCPQIHRIPYPCSAHRCTHVLRPLRSYTHTDFQLLTEV